jgi:hypothetical protein
MSDDRISEGNISRAELAELAVLFDQFEFAFDPLSLAARESESTFDDLVLSLFEERVKPNHPALPLHIFHSKIRSLCRAYLRKGTI